MTEGKLPVDPGAFFREMLSHWENMANEFGTQMLKNPEINRAAQSASNVNQMARNAAGEVMERTLAAISMPSRSEVMDLGARLTRVEAALGRIEALLAAGASSSTSSTARPKPSRNRKPVKKV